MSMQRLKTNINHRKPLRARAVFAIVALAIPLGVAAKPPITPNQDFGRMFHELPAFAPATDAVINALLELGKPGGLMDANDDLAAGPVALITDPNLSLINRNNPTHTAAVTFFGQFLDHDMTFDQTSPLGVSAPPRKSPNARTAFFDLDSVYGGGPTGSPELSDHADPIKFRIETNGQFEDLPRELNKQAIIEDPRNDENLILAGMRVRAITRPLFRSNFKLTIDLVIAWCGPPIAPISRATMDNRSSVSFFDPAGENSIEPVDLRGSARAPRRFIGWQTFFDFGGVFSAEAKPNKRIDTKVSTPLFNLPLGTIFKGKPPVSLMQRNLLRCLTWSLSLRSEYFQENGHPAAHP
jgi:hypothetical protein